LGKVRRLVDILVLAAIAVALLGIGWFLFGGSGSTFIPYNNLITVCGLIVLVTVLAVKKLSDTFLVLLNRRVLAIGTLAFATEALWVNVSRALQYETPRLLDHLGFAVFLLAFGYVAAQIVSANERRLLSIENQLEVARKLQFSILPTSLPEVPNLRIAAAYRPMTAVGGDFYDFLSVDRHRTGFLVSDVTGHGVPAALIASMIKVAIQSAAPNAHDPRAVLRGLNRALFGQLRDQLVSAAYLWLDTEQGSALHSAAGHPPLLRWRDGALERISSNGLLFGVIPDPDYPVSELPIHPGDRFLLYTDGVIEAENASGDFFGDERLEQVVRSTHLQPPAEFVDRLLSEIRI
jgi:sigma-B regulation protein RsbU (phosphoserine phosphatase)